MVELSDREHWESVNSSQQRVDDHHSRLGQLLARTFGESFFERFFEHAFWNKLLGQYLEPRRGGSMLEIGVAPGITLVRQARKYGLTPWGIEYSESGLARTRELFRSLKLDHTKVLSGDICDTPFTAQYVDNFDVVYSGGLIEHFSNPAEIVGHHFRLVKPDGLLIITIPNLRSMYGPLTRLIDPERYAIHNVDIMTIPTFRALFSGLDGDMKFLGYMGFVDFDLVQSSSTRWGRFLGPILSKLNLLANVAARYVLLGHAPENRLTSPYLVAVLHKPRR